MRGRAAPPHPRIYRLPPPHPGGKQIMSKDKYPSICRRQMEAIQCVYYPSNIFRSTCGFENWGISSTVNRMTGNIPLVIQSDSEYQTIVSCFMRKLR